MQYAKQAAVIEKFPVSIININISIILFYGLEPWHFGDVKNNLELVVVHFIVNVES